MSSSPLLLGFLIIGASVGQDMSSDMSSDFLDWSSGYGSDRSGMGSDFYDYYGSEYGSEFLEEFEAEYGPDFLEALESEYGPDFLEAFESEYGSEFWEALESEYGPDYLEDFESEYGSEFLEEFEAEYGPEFWEALESEYGSEYLSDFEYAYGSGFDYADYYGSGIPSGRSLTEDDRSGGLNNCSGKKNGSPCKKSCSSPACKKAKCWESTCLTSRKYRILAATATQQRKENSPTYNNCQGKKDGDSCTKQCTSKTCKEAKCCKTVCLTGRKYNMFKGNC